MQNISPSSSATFLSLFNVARNLGMFLTVLLGAVMDWQVFTPSKKEKQIINDESAYDSGLWGDSPSSRRLCLAVSLAQCAR